MGYKVKSLSVEEFEANGMFLNCTGKSTKKIQENIANEGYNAMSARGVHMLFSKNKYSLLLNLSKNGENKEYRDSLSCKKVHSHRQNISIFYDAISASEIPQNHKNFILDITFPLIGEYDNVDISFDVVKEFGNKISHLKGIYTYCVMSMKFDGSLNRDMHFFVRE